MCRIAQVDVRCRHVDLRAQNVCAVRELAILHALEEVQVLFDAAFTKRRVGPRYRERAATVAHLFCALALDIGMAATDQVFGELDHPVKVVGGKIQVALRVRRAFADRVFPGIAKPAYRIDDRIDVFLFFLFRTYSCSSFSGLVSSKRRWQRPPKSCANPKLRQIDLAWPKCR